MQRGLGTDDKEVREGGKQQWRPGMRAEKGIEIIRPFSAHWWNLIGFPPEERGRERIKKMRFSFHCVIFFFLL